MKKQILLGLVLIMGSIAQAQMLIYAQLFGHPTSVTPLTFSWTGFQTNWTAPSITMPLGSWSWTDPNGATVYMVPPVTFWTNSGNYQATPSSWAGVTQLGFGQSGASRSSLTNIANMDVVGPLMVNLATLASFASYQTNNFINMANLPFAYWTNVTTLLHAFDTCSGLTGPIPSSITNLTKVTVLDYAFNGCGSLTGAVPNIATMTNVASMSFAFSIDSKLTGTMPDLSGLTLMNNLQYAFQNCSLITGSIFSLSQMPALTSLNSTFRNCSSMSGSIPSLSSLTNLTTLASAFYSCTNLTGPFPVVTASTNNTSLSQTFYNCSGVTGTVDSIFVNTNGLTKLTKSDSCFSGCKGLTGNGMVFVNATKAASYSVGTASTNSSYRTFYNCTNLTDYATIPAAYK